MTDTVSIDLGERSYDILIGQGLLDSADTWRGLPSAACAAIVTNETVAPLYAARLQRALAPHYGRVLVVESQVLHESAEPRHNDDLSPAAGRAGSRSVAGADRGQRCVHGRGNATEVQGRGFRRARVRRDGNRDVVRDA